MMKTAEEFYKEIEGSEELQKAIAEINDAASLKEFLKKHGCEAGVEEFAEFLRAQNEGAITDESASTIAGGSPVYIRDEYLQKPESKLIL